MKPTVTLGIPAYNEEKNISYLLKQLQKQIEESYHLEKIIIVSDGSSDKTAENAKNFHNARISVIDRKERLGLASSQNEILETATSDILILLNADIHITDSYFIEHLIQPIIEKKADLVTPEFKQLLPSTFFERILYRSNEFKTSVYEEFRNGKNVYTCCGPARAFSKRLYTKLRFKDSANEDAYSYIYAILNGYKYSHIHDTAVYFKLPSNLSDHKKQSTRFFYSKNKLIEEFGTENIKKNYNIPMPVIANIVRKYLLKYPLEISIYAGILSFTWFMSQFNKKKQNLNIWESAKSSKLLKK